jgi:pSer/pThr/pTyr-binding forkhead associated (FHA) protein
MSKITLNRENFKVEERELEQGTLSIGRNQDNNLPIDDPAVSSHHAQIVTVFDSTYVEDLGSTNGTFVNGKKVKTHTLHNGDVLTIGHYQILFQQSHAVHTQDANSTMMIGVAQLEELTKKAQQKEAAPTQKPVRRAASRPAARTTPRTRNPAFNQNPAPVASKPKLKVHENAGQPSPDNTELPDIDDAAPLLKQTQRTSDSPHLYNRRKSDRSSLPSLKVIVLSVLATVATFTLLMLVFK